MKNNLLNKKKKGFTLIELIVVIAIIGVLAAVAIPRFSNQTEAARQRADELTAKNIAMAVQTELAKGLDVEDLDIEDGVPADDDGTEDDSVLIQYFNNGYPEPQASGKTIFFIDIDGSNNVKVYYDGATGTPLYPQK